MHEASEKVAPAPVADERVERRNPASPRRLRRHRFSDQLRREIRRHFALDNWHGPLQLLEDWIVIAGSAAASLAAWSARPGPWAWVVYAAAVFLIGTRQRALADLLHQASHRTLARNRRWNFILGTFPSGYLVLQSFSGYTDSHVYKHHRHLGDPKNDPDYVSIRAFGLYGQGMTDRQLWRYFASLVFPSATLRYLWLLCRYRILNPSERAREALFRLLYIAGLVGGCVALGGGKLLLLYWVVPMLTTASWVGNVIELTEHYPLMETAPKMDLHLSRNRVCGPIVNALFGIHWEGYHLVHHLFPGVPSWHYRRVHELLLGDPVYAGAHQRPGALAVLADLFPSRHAPAAAVGSEGSEPFATDPAEVRPSNVVPLEARAPEGPTSLS